MADKFAKTYEGPIRVDGADGSKIVNGELVTKIFPGGGQGVVVVPADKDVAPNPTHTDKK